MTDSDSDESRTRRADSPSESGDRSGQSQSDARTSGGSQSVTADAPPWASSDSGEGTGSDRTDVPEIPPSLYESMNTFYRGEMDRVTTWRTRLDQTTNWAVVVMAAILTWAFSSDQNPHYVILIGVLAVTVFLFMEAQRYQEYDVWRERVRVVQREHFAEVFNGGDPVSGEWRGWLDADLDRPTIYLSLLLAVGHRLQHIYLPLLTVMLAAWGLRITVFESDEAWRRTASIANVPGDVVVAGVATFYLMLVGLTVWTMRTVHRREFEGDADRDLPEK